MQKFGSYLVLLQAMTGWTSESFPTKGLGLPSVWRQSSQNIHKIFTPISYSVY